MVPYDAMAMTPIPRRKQPGGFLARHGSTLVAVTLAILLSQPAPAAEVLLTGTEDSPAVQNFVAELRQRREHDNVHFTVISQLPEAGLIAADTRMILLDPAGLDWRLREKRGPPTLVLRINRLQAHQRMDEQRPENLTLLWSDPPPGRQLRLIRQLLPNARKIGVLFSKNSQFMLKDLRHAATALGMHIISQPWDSTDDNRPVQLVLKSSDVLLGLEDPSLYNPRTMKNLLLSSYAEQEALIGPTASFVRAGSLASTYSDQVDWIDTLDDLLNQPPANWPRALYPYHFKVLSNPQVARSLGLAPINEADVAASLIEGERRP